MTEAQCIETIEKINQERIVLSLICGFVVARTIKLMKSISDESVFFLLFIILMMHNFAFLIVLILMHQDSKQCREKLAEIREQADTKGANDFDKN